MYKQKSLFFPMLLVVAGVVWLLINMNLMPVSNLWALTHVWPFFLIGAGLGLLLSNWWEFGRPVVSALVLLGVLLAILYAPQLGWDQPQGWSIGSGFVGSIAGSGHLVTETRELNDFERIAIRYPAEITIQQGQQASISIEADDNLLPQLETSVRNGELVFRNSERDWSDRVNPSEWPTVSITVTELSALDFDGAGSIRLQALTTEQLVVDLDGAGEIILEDLQADSLSVRLDGAGSTSASGQVGQLEVDINGLGSLHAQDLQSEQADVQINGAGDAEVNVSDSLRAQINGAGSISYLGSPQVDREVNGIGSISRIND